MPDFLGGSCKVCLFLILIVCIELLFYTNVFCYILIQVKIPEGGFVPKNLYLKEGELEKEACTITEDSIYESVTLTKGQVLNYFIFYYYKLKINFFVKGL